MIGYQKQWDFLKRKFESNQLSHSYLLSGRNAGSIKFFSKEFIKYIYYASPNFNGRGNQEKGEASCGSCQNCKMIERENLPDLLIIKSSNSTSSLKDGVDKIEIDISQIREAQNFLNYKPYYGNYKTIIIENAERMNQEAQSCFLKSLEEPKGKTIIFLISSKPDLLLPTIVSRCQEIKFFYTSKYEITKDEEKIFKNLQNVIGTDLAEKFQYAKLADLSGENFNKILNILQKYFRSLLLAKIEKNTSLKIHPNDLDDKYSIRRLKTILELTDKISRQSDTTNLNNKLALEIILMEI